MSIYPINHREIRIARMRAGLQNQQALADRVGCARNTISEAERGHCSDSLIKRIADALGLPVERFYDVTARGVDELSDDERAIVDMLRTLNPAGVRRIKDWIGGFQGGGLYSRRPGEPRGFPQQDPETIAK